MSIIRRSLTYSDLEKIRETSDELLELIDGELFVTPSPTPLHQFVSQRLYDLLKEIVVRPGLGLIAYAPLDVYFGEQTILQPDLIVLIGDRVEQIDDKLLSGPPSLVIEIASPSTTSRDRGLKRSQYALHGVPEYWFVDPDTRTVTVFSSIQDGQYRREVRTNDLARSHTIPNLVADLDALFAPVRGN